MQLSQRIIIVDDDLSVRSALTNLLQSEGYETQAFESAEALLSDEAVLRDAALFIIDVELKGMSGFDLFKELITQLINPPGIIISGNGDDNLLWYAINLGAITFMRKPIDIDALFEHIRAELSARTLRP